MRPKYPGACCCEAESGMSLEGVAMGMVAKEVMNPEGRGAVNYIENQWQSEFVINQPEKDRRQHAGQRQQQQD